MKQWKQSEDEVARLVTQKRGIFHRDSVPAEDYCVRAVNLHELLKGEELKAKLFGDQDFAVVDSGPVSLKFNFSVTTKDSFKLNGDLTLTYVLQNEAAANNLIAYALGALSVQGKEAVLKKDLEGMLASLILEAATTEAAAVNASDLCLNRRQEFYAGLKAQLSLERYGLGKCELVCDWSGEFLDLERYKAITELQQRLRDADTAAARNDLSSQIGLFELKKRIVELRARTQEELLAAERARVDSFFAQRKAEQDLEIAKKRGEQGLEIEKKKEEQDLYIHKRKEEQALELERIERETTAKISEYRERTFVLEKELQVRDREILLARSRPESTIAAPAGEDINNALRDLVAVLNKLLSAQGIKQIKSPQISEIEEKVNKYESKAGPLLPELYLRLGNLAYSDRKLQTALRWYDKLIGVNPRSEFGWNNKGAVLDDIGNTAEALRCYDCALEIRPEFSEALNNKAVSLYRRGDIGGSRMLLKRAVELDLGKSQISYNLAVVDFKLGKREDARARLENIVHHGEANAATYVALGDLQVAEKNYHKADEYYSKAVMLSPGNKTIWLRRLTTFLSTGDTEGVNYCMAIMSDSTSSKLALAVMRPRNVK